MAREENGVAGLAWFILGAAVGAAVALLYAPQSGRETRDYLTRKTEEGRELLTEKGREVADKGRELYDRGKDLADEAADIFERGRKLVRG